ENGLAAPEVDVSRRQVVQAFVVSTVVVVLDELLDAGSRAVLAGSSCPAGSSFSSSGDIARSCPASSGGKAGRGYVCCRCPRATCQARSTRRMARYRSTAVPDPHP